MPEHATWKETVPSHPRRVTTLTYVLSYDDLLADSTMTVRIDAAVRRVQLGRAASDVAGGRSPSELLLHDNWASSRHATVVREGTDRHGGVDILCDEGSSNGTFVNGERLSGKRRLMDGDLIEVGHSLLCYRTVDEAIGSALDGRGDLPRIGPTATRCPEMAALARDLARIAPSNEPVFILGETGSGKEILARMVHDLSGRTGSYVTIDCGAIPDGLFEATFFGHGRGAFTGAIERRTGEIVRAHGGTLFLDEVTNMSGAAQPKLLRVIEEAAVSPLGGDRRRVDVRWIAATNSPDPTDETVFRPDLLRRLAGYVATMPPLRKRREDLGALSAHLLRAAGVERASITAAAGRRLFNDAFPGNIRQLRTTLRGAAILAGTAPIDLPHLDAVDLRARHDHASPRQLPPRPPRRGTLCSPDAGTVERALAASGGNVVRAADLLESHPRQVSRWMERLGVDVDRFRKP
jgi:sigma-54 dependent transcriptional regulator, acetoin dehydrogenase operon transcriptional activator AcoR